MADVGFKILVVGGQAEDVRLVDGAVHDLGIPVDWIEPADVPDRLDPDLLLVVLDLDNPGLAAARVFRDDPATRHTPLVFLAAPDASPAMRARAFGFVPSDCLTRPLVSDVLRARARLVFDLRLHPGGPVGPELDAALRDDHDRITALGDNLPDVAIYQFVLGSGGGRRFTYMSAGIERILGVTADEVLADAGVIYERVVPEDLPGLLAAETQATENRTAFDHQFRLRSRSGGVRCVRCRSAPRKVKGVLVWDGLMTDRTAERQAVEALRASEERFRRMADSAPVFIWQAGPDRRRAWFNKPWLDFTGRTLEQERGEGWANGVHPDDRERFLAANAEAFTTRRPFVHEFRLRRHDGVYRWVLGHGVSLTGPDGSFAGFIGSAMDITDRKEMEEALRAADKRREDYLAMLAHELRNPLAPIRTGLHILARKPDDVNLVTETRAMMARQVENMARIVDDLLDVSRVARGKVTIRKSRFDLADVGRTCTDDRRAVAEGAGLWLVFAAPGGPVWVDGDITRISQVLDNLIHNAIKFTPKGGTVSVTVTAEGDMAVARVRDTGIGIDAGMLPYLFEVFSQADRSLARSKGGLGLGLALAKGLVDLHDGTIEARSEGAGKGSEFAVRLPKSAEPAALTEVPVSPSSVGKKRRILVIEDNRDSAESLRTLLDLSGYEVEVAYSGPAGLDASIRFKPHAVVCDIGLPGLDGYEVARLMRLRPETTNSRLIAVTGYGRAEDVEKSRRAGFNQHLTKPVDPQELLENLVFAK
jgi:PAS domain S-box-containing protein